MRHITTLAALAILTGCATAPYAPLVDRPGPTYAADLTDCQAYANTRPSATEGAVGGAIAGAVFSALIGAALGVKDNGLNQVGAISGAVGGAGSAAQDRKAIVTNCLVGRGHRVLQ